MHVYIAILIYLCVHLYNIMYVCVCMHACIRVCAFVCACVCTCGYIAIDLSVFVPLCMRLCLHNMCMCVYGYIHAASLVPVNLFS